MKISKRAITEDTIGTISQYFEEHIVRKFVEL